ncbi:hypothetical protein BH10PAT2_BH10PAT2_0910 [soil metagenome]
MENLDLVLVIQDNPYEFDEPLFGLEQYHHLIYTVKADERVKNIAMAGMVPEFRGWVYHPNCSYPNTLITREWYVIKNVDVNQVHVSRMTIGASTSFYLAGNEGKIAELLTEANQINLERDQLIAQRRRAVLEANEITLPDYAKPVWFGHKIVLGYTWKNADGWSKVMYPFYPPVHKFVEADRQDSIDMLKAMMLTLRNKRRRG